MESCCVFFFFCLGYFYKYLYFFQKCEWPITQKGERKEPGGWIAADNYFAPPKGLSYAIGGFESHLLYVTAPSLGQNNKIPVFFMHHCPLAASRPRWRWQRDPLPSGAILTLPPKDGAKPSQSGLYPPFNLILFFPCCWVHVLSLCSSFHYFWSFLWS